MLRALHQSVFSHQDGGIITYKRGKLSARTLSILMTLKSWGKTDKADTNEEEFGEDTN